MIQSQDVCATSTSITSPYNASLIAFAKKYGINYSTPFWHVSAYIQKYGTLPACYVTKQKATSMGWHEGDDLWKYAKGDSIGGDTFQNNEKKLPSQYSYIESDLDYAGGHRGAKRLIYAKGNTGQWKQWVTVDHYTTFYPIPMNK